MSLISIHALRRGWRVPALAATATVLSLAGVASAPAAVTAFNAVSPVGDPAGYAQTPFALVGQDGSTAAVWRDSNAETVLLRRVDAGGIPAASIATLSVPGYYENTPEAAQAANGTVGVFWQKIQMGTYQRTLRFVSVAPDGTQTATNQVGAVNAGSPGVGLAADGSGWLSWTEYANGKDHVYAARVAADGTVGAPTAVSDDNEYSEYPRIAVAANGAAWLVWENNDDDTLRVAYAAPGEGFGTPHAIAADDPDYDTLAIGISSHGDGVLSYTDDPPVIDYATELVRLPAGGSPSTPVRLEEHDTSDAEPSVAVRPDGSGVVTWLNDDVDEVHARSFAADGTLSALRVVSVPGLSVSDRPRAVVGNGGRDAVIWYEDATSTGGAYEVKMREYSADGIASAVEPVSDVLPTATPQPGELSAGYSPDGTFVAAWTARAADNSATQIYTRSALAGPANESAPATGAAAPVVGQQITGTAGRWSGTGPLTYAYRWLRCTSATDASACVPIDGATSLSYTVTAADLSAGYLRLRVSATNAIDPVGATALSDATVRVADVPAAAAPAATPAATTSAPATATPAPAGTAAPVGLTPEAMKVGLAVTDDGFAQIPLSCPATVTGCNADGTLSIALPKAARTSSARAAAVRAASPAETVLARFQGVKIASGQSKLVKVRLTPSVLRRLQRAGVRRVRVTLHTNNHLDGRAPVQATQRVWLLIPALGKVCKVAGRLTVHWVLPSGVRLRSVTIAANGRVVARPAADARSATIAFAANSPSVTRFTITAVTTTGRKLGGQRLRLLCGGRRPAGYRPVKSLVLKPLAG